MAFYRLFLGARRASVTPPPVVVTPPAESAATTGGGGLGFLPSRRPLKPAHLADTIFEADWLLSPVVHYTPPHVSAASTLGAPDRLLAAQAQAGRAAARVKRTLKPRDRLERGQAVHTPGEEEALLRLMGYEETTE